MSTKKRASSVYSKAVAEKVQGKYNKKFARVIRNGMIMFDDQAEKANKRFEQTGLFYTKLDADTKKYLDGEEWQTQEEAKAKADKK